jgi:hypothetical protein
MDAHTSPECPRCKQHTIVQTGANEWGCLSCGFSRSLMATPPQSNASKTSTPNRSPNQDAWFPLVWTFFIAIVMAVFFTGTLQVRFDPGVAGLGKNTQVSGR